MSLEELILKLEKKRYREYEQLMPLGVEQRHTIASDCRLAKFLFTESERAIYRIFHNTLMMLFSHKVM